MKPRSNARRPVVNWVRVWLRTQSYRWVKGAVKIFAGGSMSRSAHLFDSTKRCAISSRAQTAPRPSTMRFSIGMQRESAAQITSTVSSSSTGLRGRGTYTTRKELVKNCSLRGPAIEPLQSINAAGSDHNRYRRQPVVVRLAGGISFSKVDRGPSTVSSPSCLETDGMRHTAFAECRHISTF